MPDLNQHRIPVILAIMFACSSTAAAQTTANQTVTFQVDAINQIAFTGSPSLVINAALAGSNPNSVSTGVTWAVTTNQSNAKITASVNAAMPASVTLTVDLAAPSGATSAGAQSLGTTAVDLVTGITQVAQGGLAVTYTLSATAAAGVVASTTRTVTYTITGGT
jgi:hypothetical protein